MARSLLAPALALLALVAPLSGAVLPAPVASPPGDCLGGTADCEALSPSDLLVTPLAGTGTVLDILGPFLSPAVRSLVKQAYDLSPVKGDVIPPRPQGPTVEAQVHERIKLKAAGLHVNEKVHVHQEVNTSADGPYGEDQVPCVDPRGCPDLVVDPSMLAVGMTTVETFAPTDCAVLEGSTEAGTRRLLRFTFTTPNVGDGDLYVGAPAQHASWFTWGACHSHWHFRDYADYRLWTPDGYANWLLARGAEPDAAPDQVLAAHPELRDGFLGGHKQGFCVIDVRLYATYLNSQYHDCANNQGITRGWADEYGYTLDGQWIDVTGLQPGAYVLEAEVNPERLYRELDYGNNSGALLIQVPA